MHSAENATECLFLFTNKMYFNILCIFFMFPLYNKNILLRNGMPSKWLHFLCILNIFIQSV